MTATSTGMTRLTSFPFTSHDDGYDDDGYPIYDRAVDSSVLREVFAKFFSNGVFPNPGTALQIGKATTGLAVTIQPGIGIINGAMGGVQGSDPITVTLDTAAPQGNVCYGIMLRYDNTDTFADSRSLLINVVRGDASSTPTPPAPDTTSLNVYELRLGYVTVPSGAVDMTNATVTNEKGTDLCPYAAPFEDIDMSTVTADAQESASQALQQFLDELAGYEGVLDSAVDETTATYLQSQINDMKSGMTDSEFVSYVVGRTVVVSGDDGSSGNGAKLAKASNNRALYRLFKSGTISNAPSGWNSYTFESAFPLAPLIIAQGVDTGVTAEIKNVLTTGFDYRILYNGADTTGKEIQWFGYIVTEVSNAIMEEVNEIIGTDYDSIDDLLANQTDFAKVCASKDAMDVLFTYDAAVDAILASPACVDTVLNTPLSYSELSDYSDLNNGMQNTDMPDAKYTAKLAGIDTSTVANYAGLFGNTTSMDTVCQSADAMGHLTSNAFSINKMETSAQALNRICRFYQSRKTFNAARSTLNAYKQTIIATMKAATDLFSYTSYGSGNYPSTAYLNYIVNVSNRGWCDWDSKKMYQTGDMSNYNAEGCFTYMTSASGKVSDMYALPDGTSPEYIVASDFDQNDSNNCIVAGGMYMDTLYRVSIDRFVAI